MMNLLRGLIEGSIGFKKLFQEKVDNLFKFEDANVHSKQSIITVIVSNAS